MYNTTSMKWMNYCFEDNVAKQRFWIEKCFVKIGLKFSLCVSCLLNLHFKHEYCKRRAFLSLSLSLSSVSLHFCILLDLFTSIAKFNFSSFSVYSFRIHILIVFHSHNTQHSTAQSTFLCILQWFLMESFTVYWKFTFAQNKRKINDKNIHAHICNEQMNEQLNKRYTFGRCITVWGWKNT